MPGRANPARTIWRWLAFDGVCVFFCASRPFRSDNLTAFGWFRRKWRQHRFDRFRSQFRFPGFCAAAAAATDTVAFKSIVPRCPTEPNTPLRRTFSEFGEMLEHCTSSLKQADRTQLAQSSSTSLSCWHSFPEVERRPSAPIDLKAIVASVMRPSHRHYNVLQTCVSPYRRLQCKRVRGGLVRTLSNMMPEMCSRKTWKCVVYVWHQSCPFTHTHTQKQKHIHESIIHACAHPALPVVVNEPSKRNSFHHHNWFRLGTNGRLLNCAKAKMEPQFLSPPCLCGQRRKPLSQSA